jgi:hypothetical protein
MAISEKITKNENFQNRPNNVHKEKVKVQGSPGKSGKSGQDLERISPDNF